MADRPGDTVQRTRPSAPLISTRAGPNAALPAGRLETSTRVPASGWPPAVASSTIVPDRPNTSWVGPEATSRWTVAGLATANCHITGPATLPERSATVTAIVWTPAPRLPGA